MTSLGFAIYGVVTCLGINITIHETPGAISFLTAFYYQLFQNKTFFLTEGCNVSIETVNVVNFLLEMLLQSIHQSINQFIKVNVKIAIAFQVMGRVFFFQI